MMMSQYPSPSPSHYHSGSNSSAASFSSSDDDRLPPLSSIFSSSIVPFDPLFDPTLPDPFQAYLAGASDEREGSTVLSLPQPPLQWLLQGHGSGGEEDKKGEGDGGEQVGVMEVHGGASSISSQCLPHVLGLNGDLHFAPRGEDGDATRDDLEQARRRQLKAELRKERNKAAARRSNFNKKLIRDQLEKKSLELWEENLQLHQDIRELTNKLRHFRQLRKAMQHVCHRPPGMTTYR